jgi:hypothetical protein
MQEIRKEKKLKFKDIRKEKKKFKFKFLNKCVMIFRLLNKEKWTAESKFNFICEFHVRFVQVLRLTMRETTAQNPLS